MLERTFLREKAKKRDEQLKKEQHHQKEERDILRKKRAHWNPLKRRQRQAIGTAPAQEI